MTAPKPEAPTLDSTDAAVGKRWRENSSLEEWFPYTAEELDALRERLRAIENAKGMPKVPRSETCGLCGTPETVYKQDYDALRLHAQRLQDKLNRL